MPGSIVGSPIELARTYEREIGGRPIARRRWAVNLSDDTLTNDGPPGTASIITACVGNSANWGTAHPDLTWLGLRKATFSERFEDDPYKVEVVAEYGLLTSQELLHPTSRNNVWSFESQAGEVAALFYYHGSGQGNRRPLTNTAYDYFPGLTRDESVVLIKIQKNFQYLNTTSVNAMNWLAVQNFVNSATYTSIGAGVHTLKVTGVDVQYTTEEWNGQEVSYWAATATLAYRQSTHNLLLPDVGFNYIDQTSGQKRRAMVFDFQNSEWVATANPVGLNGTNGGQTFGIPGVLERRVNPEADLQPVFGNPPS